MCSPRKWNGAWDAPNACLALNVEHAKVSESTVKSQNMKIKSTWLTSWLAIIIITSFFFIILQGLFPFNQAFALIGSYAYLESLSTQLLVSLVFALLLVNIVTKYDHSIITVTLGAALAMLFFVNILGLKMVAPTQIDWLMRGDWGWHFMGWHFFRNEPWQWPLGKITNFFFPVGTSIGYTDSIPLLALLFKPFSAFLPANFQYLGLWIFISYILQGVFAALLIRLVSKNLLIQVVGTLFFVMSPVLINRLGHEALCAHWLLLAGLWMYFRTWDKSSPYQALTSWILLISIGALTHPYLTVMLLGLATAFYARFWLIDQKCTMIPAFLQLALLGLTCLLMWWQAGYFLIENKNMTGINLGHYSMNLLSPFNAMGGGSLLFRDMPHATNGQGEGFNYLGAGVLLMGIWVLYELNTVQRATLKKHLPLIIVCIAFTLFAVSNKVTIGSVVLIDIQSQLLNSLAIFQSSGRFFWVVNYTLLFLIISVLIVRNSPRKALFYLSFALAIQSLDLFPAYQFHQQARDNPARHWDPKASPGWDNPLNLAHWKVAMPYYQHITLVEPRYCGKAAAPYLPFSYLAASHGMTINTSMVARFDAEKTRQYCQTLREEIGQGKVKDDTIYILHPKHLENFKKAAQLPIICAKIDGFNTCVTKQSFTQWQVDS